MKIVIAYKSKIPVFLYGGTERVIWALAKELTNQGHELTFLVGAGSTCDFAKVIIIQQDIPILEQVPRGTDVVHFNFEPEGLETFDIPYVITMHGNINGHHKFDKNTIFVSENHAARYNSKSFVHNGMDWDEYAQPNLKQPREYFHFLGNAAWRVKNVQGAIDIINESKSERLKVLGGVRFNFNMGIRFTFSPKISFAGMVGGTQKTDLLNKSKGLIFPIKWHEPFGIAITESLFYGCPVFATPYGSLPEIVTKEFGFLSNNKEELKTAIANVDTYSKQKCYEYARDEFNSLKMSYEYLNKYNQVINGAPLNEEAPDLLRIQKEKYLEWN